MDQLKAFLSAKRKAEPYDELPDAKRQRTWVRGDERRAEADRRLADEQARVDRERAAAREAKEAADRLANEEIDRVRQALDARRTDEERAHEDPLLKLAVDEVKRMLRARREVVTYFGETDDERRARLRRVVMQADEFMPGSLNDFKATEEAERERLLEEAIEAEKGGLAVRARDSHIVPVYAVREPTCVEERVWFFLMRMFDIWSLELDSLAPESKLTREAKRSFATHKQCRNYIEPLFEMLEARAVPADILSALTTIVGFLQARDYVAAQDAYLQLSIGNSPWPIGVTMVGIHERSGREKISASNVAVAHILNNERDRKYIQSVKRIMTFCETRFPRE